jgi:hypothetical protein
MLFRFQAEDPAGVRIIWMTTGVLNAAGDLNSYSRCAFLVVNRSISASGKQHTELPRLGAKALTRKFDPAQSDYFLCARQNGAKGTPSRASLQLALGTRSSRDAYLAINHARCAMNTLRIPLPSFCGRGSISMGNTATSVRHSATSY